MARKKKARKRGDNVALELTPMIDVVFQLLIFFIVTLKQEDILSRLNISRPAPDSRTTEMQKVDDMLTITVFRKGYEMNGVFRGPEYLRTHIKKLAGYGKNLTVIIKCTSDSPHAYLVSLLDICSEANLTNISVFSL